MKVRRTIDIRVKAAQLEVGDVIRFKLCDGEKCEARAALREDDRMLMVFEECLSNLYAMNPKDSTDGGWEGCALRKELNSSIINKFPHKLREHMIPFEDGDYLTLLTLGQVFGEDWDDNKTNDQLEMMKNRKNRVASAGQYDYVSWWLRDVVGSTAFAVVSGNGYANSDSAGDSRGVRPAFLIRLS